jgi:hypothetical protein
MSTAVVVRETFADPNMLEFSGASTTSLRVFHYRTSHTLSTVLGSGYFDNLMDAGLRRDDRIEILADTGGLREHALAVVDRVSVDGIVVSLLLEYRRS